MRDKRITEIIRGKRITEIIRGKRITEIIRGKRKALKSNDFKAFFRGDGGIRTHDLYTARYASGVLLEFM